MAARASFAVALFAAMVALVACGGGGDSSDEEAQAILDRTFSPHSSIESGELDLKLGLEVRQDGGTGGGLLQLDLKGPFESPDAEMPSFDLDGTASLENLDEAVTEPPSRYEGSLTSTGDAGYLGYRGFRYLAGDYELDPTLFALLERVLLATPDAGSLLADPVDEGETEIDGAPVAHVSADLDAEAAGAALNAALAGAGDLGFGVDPAGQLPPAAVERLAGLIDGARVDVYSGTEDGLLRRLTISATLSDVSAEQIDLTLDTTVSAVNEPQTIEAPADPEPLVNLLKKYVKLASALG